MKVYAVLLHLTANLLGLYGRDTKFHKYELFQVFQQCLDILTLCFTNRTDKGGKMYFDISNIQKSEFFVYNDNN